MQTITVDSNDFGEIRREGYVYVDANSAYQFDIQEDYVQ